MTDARPGRVLAPGQRCEIRLAVRDGGDTELLLSTDALLLEAPNWSPDGRALLLNGDGALWRVPLDAPEPERIPIEGLPPINNDHVVAPDGASVLLTGQDGHLYRAPIDGGTAVRLMEEDGLRHYLHGVSPDGSTLAAVVLPRDGWSAGRLELLPAAGGRGRLLDTGAGHLDGPEFTPDGAWIVCNSEAFAAVPGHAQLIRLPAAGGRVERLVVSDTVDWFPHPSPDGTRATYLAYPPGTEGHPADLAVEVRLVATDDWSTPLATYPLHGGQGTLNVNGWSPDSTRFAFVAYPID